MFSKTKHDFKINALPIETERLILRLPKERDLEQFHAAKTAVWAELQQWMSWASDDQASLEASQNFITDTHQKMCDGFMPLFGICKLSRRFVVATGLNLIPEIYLEYPDDYSTGYWVAPDFLGQGYATEATAAVIRFAFEVQKARAVHIGYFDGNEKSRRIIDKLGFEFVKTQDAFHTCFATGKKLDHHDFIMYSADHLAKFRADWRMS